MRGGTFSRKKTVKRKATKRKRVVKRKTATRKRKMKAFGMKRPKGRKVDDLKLISGVGPKLERTSPVKM